ncbi:hypothetical protein JMUB5695_00790 [Mycobacterium heckeshornense]|uniref:hypothetical protein n=1 Tax=Mycobacterium heckeshornense TaxID=110505 RepID=UPI0019412FB9|nr:hypothetical protein [Mycobacterium heckeshornense]BCQ07369.1 hypothetical protein JMUB5695_00790 [Mycobacterium heckeshornense]
MTDFLLSADLMVPDPDGHAKLLVERIGVLQHPNWRQAFATHGYIAHFLRVHKSLAVAPTRLEPQHHWEVEKPVDPIFSEYLDSLHEFQGRFRPIKTHSCVIATDDIEALIEKLHRRRLPFRIAPIDDHLAWERLWVGTTPEQPRYRPVVDGGLCLEWHPIAPLQMPPETFGETPPQPRDPQPGQMIRIVNRSFLVRDLDATLRLLDTNLDIVPSGPVELFEREGYRRARIGFTVGHSATLDLIEPVRWNCETGRYLATWGPGPYNIRIAVNGLDAKAADLDARQTRYTRKADSEAVGGPYLQVDPKELDGTLIEFVEA